MSINQDQFDKLSEMGISLWQSRIEDSISDTEPVIEKKYLNIDLTELLTQQLFADILLSAGLSVGEVNLQDDHLDLGLFNWFFTDNINANDLNTDDKNAANQSAVNTTEPLIRWSEQQLFTPSITEIAKSPALKKQLWQLLGSKTQ